MKYRMYCLSERHLSLAQKTLQAAHAIVEYSLKYSQTPEYKQWSENDKTIIVLDGGNSQDMADNIRRLSMIRHAYEIFEEPDMGNFVTSVAFLADDRVWNYERYGCSWFDFQGIMEKEGMVNVTYEQWREMIGGQKVEILKSIISEKRLAQ